MVVLVAVTMMVFRRVILIRPLLQLQLQAYQETATIILILLGDDHGDYYLYHPPPEMAIHRPLSVLFPHRSTDPEFLPQYRNLVNRQTATTILIPVTTSRY